MRGIYHPAFCNGGVEQFADNVAETALVDYEERHGATAQRGTLLVLIRNAVLKEIVEARETIDSAIDNSVQRALENGECDRCAELNSDLDDARAECDDLYQQVEKLEQEGLGLPCPVCSHKLDYSDGFGTIACTFCGREATVV